MQNSIFAALFIGLVLSFVLLAIFSFESFDSTTGQPVPFHNHSKRVYLVPVTIATIGIAATLSGYLLTLETDRQKIINKALAENESKIAAIEQEISAGLKNPTNTQSNFRNC